MRTTLAALQAAPAGSRLVFTYVRSGLHRRAEHVRRGGVVQALQAAAAGVEVRPRPRRVEAFVGEYGWRLVEQAGPDYYLQHYLRPAGRDLAASDLEWTAYCAKQLSLTPSSIWGICPFLSIVGPHTLVPTTSPSTEGNEEMTGSIRTATLVIAAAAVASSPHAVAARGAKGMGHRRLRPVRRFVRWQSRHFGRRLQALGRPHEDVLRQVRAVSTSTPETAGANRRRRTRPRCGTRPGVCPPER